MKTYSPERKAAVIARMLPSHNHSINQLARLEGIPTNTLYYWRAQAGLSGQTERVEDKPPQGWSQEVRFAVLVETVPLSAHVVAEYYHCKDLYSKYLQQWQWRDSFMQLDPRKGKAVLKRLQKENQQIKREINCRDKALAEATALLILEKKLKALSDEENGNVMTHRQQLMVLVRISEACRTAGLSIRTLQLWKSAADDRRAIRPRPVPQNKLSAEEERQVLDICHEAQCTCLPPAQIVPQLTNENRFIASEYTFYRVLSCAGETTCCGQQRAPQSKPLATWKATGPNQVWSWDITWLKAVQCQFSCWYAVALLPHFWGGGALQDRYPLRSMATGAKGHGDMVVVNDRAGGVSVEHLELASAEGGAA